ncbi:hypothetical protein FQZ97_938710 [compost metagenome]
MRWCGGRVDQRAREPTRPHPALFAWRVFRLSFSQHPRGVCRPFVPPPGCPRAGARLPVGARASVSRRDRRLPHRLPLAAGPRLPAGQRGGDGRLGGRLPGVGHPLPRTPGPGPPTGLRRAAVARRRLHVRQPQHGRQRRPRPAVPPRRPAGPAAPLRAIAAPLHPPGGVAPVRGFRRPGTAAAAGRQQRNAARRGHPHHAQGPCGWG